MSAHFVGLASVFKTIRDLGLERGLGGGLGAFALNRTVVVAQSASVSDAAAVGLDPETVADPAELQSVDLVSRMGPGIAD